MTGSTTGVLPEEQPPTELSWRRFLLRLHTAHGYPGETNPRYGWAIIVDIMAATMCIWGITGVLMWWQIKRTRRLGFVIMIAGAASAVALGWLMHTAMTS